MPKFSRSHLLWLAIIVIVIFYVFAPTSGVTLIIRQFFHTALSMLLVLLG